MVITACLYLIDHMGFLLSVFYFVTYYLTPTAIFGPLAVYRVELIIAILVFIISLPRMVGSSIFKTPQFAAVIGLAFAAFLSVLIAVRWTGGAIAAILGFIPNAFAYILVYLHCNSKRKLQAIVFMLLFVCLFVIAHGYIELRYGVPASGPSQSEDEESAGPNLWNTEHPYLFPMKSDAGVPDYRLRGLGLINDPNDFGQLIVCVIPMLFIFWRPRRTLRNIAFVLLPVCILLYGEYLTHSRGALLALLALTIVAARRRTGTLPALLLGGVLFVAAMSVNFTGGRDISVSSGVDRTSLWSQSMETFKTHPVFGVGIGNLGDYTDGHHTAHNSVLVCAAELGFLGLFFWSAFLFSTMRDVLAIASPTKVSEPETNVLEEADFPYPTRLNESIDKLEVNRIGRLLVLSLTGFLVAGWFLSRAYIMTFFLIGGMVEVVYEMALQRGMIAPRLPFARVTPYAAGLAISLVLLMYIILRVTNLMH
ncbi:MAG: O-antigen ligase family protein [Terracidiphilus sp.]